MRPSVRILIFNNLRLNLWHRRPTKHIGKRLCCEVLSVSIPFAIAIVTALFEMHFEANVVYIDIILRFFEFFGVTVQYLYCFPFKPVCFSFSCDGNAREICSVIL